MMKVRINPQSRVGEATFGSYRIEGDEVVDVTKREFEKRAGWTHNGVPVLIAAADDDPSDTIESESEPVEAPDEGDDE